MTLSPITAHTARCRPRLIGRAGADTVATATIDNTGNYSVNLFSALKLEKLAMAIIGISSIHLLRTFIEASNLGAPNATYTEAGVMWQTIIHMAFIASAIGIAYTDLLMQRVSSANKNGH